jgi:hypothetical protein
VTIEVRMNRSIANRAAQSQAGLGRVPGAADAPSCSAKAGDVLLDAELIDVHGVSVTLDASRASRPAAIVLYRGTWCQYCNLALRTHQQDMVPALEERGVALIAISPPKPDGSAPSENITEQTGPVFGTGRAVKFRRG